MKVGAPAPGSIIRYSYLWADERADGSDEGRKDRPVLVLALVVRASGAGTELLVLAVTHAPPRERDDAVELPPDVKRRLGLDDVPSWIVTTEANAFLWPGPDVRPVPGRKPLTVIYGRVPDALLTQVARSFLAHRSRRILPRPD